MNEILSKYNSKTYFLILFFGVIYALLPTANSSMDAIVYAADAKWSKDLFQSHHLFYTAFLYLIHFLVPIDFLALGKLINAVFAAASLLVLWKCLTILQKDTQKQFWIVAFVGSSFAIFRFATENETYILPIFFSLLGTYHYLKFDNDQKKTQLFVAGFWLTLACLFHQLHFFWWFILLLFIFFSAKKPLKSTFIYASTAVLVPVFYYLVLVFYRNVDFTFSTYFAFIFESFSHGKATIEIKWLGITRWLVSIFRTFFNLHYTQYIFLQKFPFFWIIPISMICVSMFLFFRNVQKIKSLTFINIKFYYLFLSLIGCFLCFALVSFGNSEFMVMLPFLIALFFGLYTNLNTKILSYFVGIQFVWNIILGVLPYHFIKFRADNYWAKKIENQPNSIFYMTNYGEISGLVYLNNQNLKQNVFFSLLEKSKMDSLLVSNINIYTDCIKSGNVINTESILFGKKNQAFYKNYKTICIDSAESFSGKEYLYQVFLK
ncbi:MAG: hypothetical protein EAZ53_04590 [Bacteroidetes bacterium]|nr:MAG: hypothetical protein EAZ53_04590 [Bacteroidota bacterium]